MNRFEESNTRLTCGEGKDGTETSTRTSGCNISIILDVLLTNFIQQATIVTERCSVFRNLKAKQNIQK